jgi:dinuclear metal center YbgI/SA1388 family protein
MARRDRIVRFLDSHLDPDGMADASCNGLQIEGAETVSTVGLAVDASLEAYAAAVRAGCQMLIVHHGLIWHGLKAVSGVNGRHVRYCIEHGLNLYASHLPLDRHPVCGNNARLARVLCCRSIKPAFAYKGVTIGCQGTLATPMTCADIAARLESVIGGTSTLLPFGKKKNRRVGIVSGGAADSLADAIDMGLDCYVTGEPAHHNHHQAKEAGINAVFAGHYHTEKPGVMAVGQLLARRFHVGVTFIDIPTIV